MNTESASRDQLAAANSSSACLSRWEAEGNPVLDYMHSHTTTNSKYARVGGEQQKLHQIVNILLKSELNPLKLTRHDSTTNKLRKSITSQPSGVISSMAGKPPIYFEDFAENLQDFTIFYPSYVRIISP